ENIYVNGSVLGILKAAIDRQLDEIVDLAQFRKFSDTRVQNYSSGMQVRLGFSIAVKLIKPDVLILDEVVAVGDEGFRSKCYEAVGDMLGRCAVLFVSHSMPMIYRLSTQVMVLADGAPMFCGDPALGIETYFKSLALPEHVVDPALGAADATISRLSLLDEHGTSPGEYRYARPHSISMD